MPELPEVEVYKNIFNKNALDKEIESVEVLDKGVLENTDEKDLNSYLIGHKFLRANRIGKYLCIELENASCLEMHFGMTGYLDFLQNGERPKSTRVIINLINGERIAYIDQRKIGHLSKVGSFDEVKRVHNLGPDALEFKDDEVLKRFKASKAKIKSALMDQTIISGIGNVYADEILFQSGIHPESISSALSDAQYQRVFENIREVLKVSVEFIKGTKLEYQKARKRLPENFLLPVRKEGENCPGGCTGKVKMIKIGGRSTYLCEKCQELIN